MKKKQIQKISYKIIDFGESKGLTEKSYIGKWIDAAVEYMLEREQDILDEHQKELKIHMKEINHSFSSKSFHSGSLATIELLRKRLKDKNKTQTLNKPNN
jgi:hypothetical protein